MPRRASDSIFYQGAVRKDATRRESNGKYSVAGHTLSTCVSLSEWCTKTTADRDRRSRNPCSRLEVGTHERASAKCTSEASLTPRPMQCSCASFLSPVQLTMDRSTALSLTAAGGRLQKPIPPAAFKNRFSSNKRQRMMYERRQGRSMQCSHWPR